MHPPVIVLNGISSSGKSTIARHLQLVLDDTYLTFGVDTLLAAMPAASALRDSALIEFDPGGGVSVGTAFRTLEAGWYAGLAAMARAGLGLIVDEVFLGGGASQARLAEALAGLDVLWVAVTCDLDVANSREATRGDRVVGMAATQLPLVHEGVTYDFSVDTTRESPRACASRIAQWASLRDRG